jgi:hypothetical protein
MSKNIEGKVNGILFRPRAKNSKLPLAQWCIR